MSELKKYKYNDVPWYLETKTYCQRERLSLKGVKPVGQRYQFKSREWVKLYDIRGLEKKKPLSDKQKVALEKANAARQKLYTCRRCGKYNLHTVSRKTGLCNDCHDYVEHMQYRIAAYQERLSWTDPESINSYVILDLETTGLDQGSDEVIEIAITTLNGDVLFNSLIKSKYPIPDDAIEQMTLLRMLQH